MARPVVVAVALAIGLLAQAPRASAQARPLTLAEAVELALANNERARKAPLRVSAAEGQLERARAAFLPTLAAGAQGTLRATEDRNGRVLAGAGTITVTQPIVAAPALPLYAQAKRQLEAERWGAVEDRRALAFDTARAFLLALANERLLEAAERRLERARATTADARARAEAGLASTNDVTRAVIGVASAEAQVAGARGNLERATLQLGYLVGREVGGGLAAPERTTRAAQEGAWRVDELLRGAEARRPDVKAAAERTAALREAAKEPMYRTLPTLSAQAVMKATVAPVPPDPAHDEQALITLSWTLYDAGARYGDDKTRGAQAESQALDERALRRSVALDVGVAVAGLRAARDTWRLAQEAVVAAQRNTEETEILYRQGLARAIELTEANASRYDAEVSAETARLAMEQAYLALRQATGLAPVGDEVAEKAVKP